MVALVEGVVPRRLAVPDKDHRTGLVLGIRLGLFRRRDLPEAGLRILRLLPLLVVAEEEVRHPEHSEPNPVEEGGEVEQEAAQDDENDGPCEGFRPQRQVAHLILDGEADPAQEVSGCGHGLLRGCGGGGGLGGELVDLTRHRSPMCGVRCGGVRIKRGRPATLEYFQVSTRNQSTESRIESFISGYD